MENRPEELALTSDKFIPVVTRKTGEVFIPKFPVEMDGGDQLVITVVIASTIVPPGKRWTIQGFGGRGIVITNRE